MSEPHTADPYAVDRAIVERLRAGDEATFAELVDRWSPAMLRLARAYMSNPHSAEDAVQEAWLGVLKGLHNYAGRSSLRTWVFAIVANVAKTNAVKEKRVTPVDIGDDPHSPQPTVDGRRFRPAGDSYPGHWLPGAKPQPWPEPESSLLQGELLGVVEAALATLPPRQRAVVSLRDIHQLSAEETCRAMDISAANQRVLLHRGRAAVRAALEIYYAH